MSLLRRRRPSAAPAEPVEQAAAEQVQVEPLPVEGGAEVAVVDDASFLALTEGGYTVVDFWAAWCAPCRSFAPVFRAVAAAHTGPVRFGACDVEANPQASALLGLTSIPTLVVFGPDGSEVGRSNGVVGRGDLEATVAQLSRR